MRALDWSTSPLGDPSGWPQSLCSVVGLLLNSKFPMFVAWGPNLGFLYNDPYSAILGAKHPAAMGRKFHDIWSEIWPDVSPLVDSAMAGEATFRENLPLLMHRHGFDEQTWFTFSYSPVRDEEGRVAGLFCACTETTDTVLGRRRRDALLELDKQLLDIASTADLSFAASEILGKLLGAARVGYGSVDAEAGTIAIERNWYAPDFDDLTGVHSFADYGSYIDDLRRGEAVANADVGADPRTAENAEAFRALGVRAYLDVPVMEAGRIVGQIFVHAAAARVWSEDEVTFVQEFAKRTHAAVARRSAEQELRDAVELQRAVFAGTSAGFLVLAPDAPRFTIIDVNDAYLRSTMTSREDIIGRPLFEVFPENPDDPAAHNVRDLRASLERTLTTKQPDAMRRLQYDIPKPRGGFEQRWWDPINTPLLNADNVVTAIIHHASERTDFELAQRALRESEERLFLAVDNAEVGFWDVDEINDRLVWPARTKAMFGISADVPVSMQDFFDGLHPDDREATGAAYAAAANPALRAVYDVEYRTVGKEDGVVRWVAAKGRGVFDGPGAAARCLRVAGTAVEITERKQAEEALGESEARYRTLFENIDVGFCVAEVDLDAFDGRADYRVIEANPAFWRQSGWDDILGRWLREAAPELEEHWYEAYAHVARTGEPMRFEQGSDLLGRWFDLYAFRVGKPAERRVAILFTDISERRRAEQSLHDLNTDLERQVVERSRERGLIWQNSLDLLSVIDLDAATFDTTNPAWSAALGWTQTELEGQRFIGYVHPDDVEITLEALERTRRGESIQRFENRYRAKDGGWHWLSWVSVPEGGKLYSVTRDVTEEKHRQAELEAAQEALRQSQKMEAMGQLTGGVAHDFNNLLTPIVGSLDLLQRRGLGDAREQRLIAGAMQSAERAKTLVQRLLAFARRQPLQSVSVDIAKLVSGMGNLVSSTTGPQIKVVVEASDDLPPAQADANQLEMALLNLSVNARDAMPDGGTLRISATAERVDAGHRSGLRPDSYVRLSVADTGAGMDEATVSRAIEPFFSTKGVGKGTGLGLSMVHGLASQLGGALTIQSRPGLGTNVELWLPLAAGAPETVEPLANPARASAVRGTALLVDDEELVRESTADMLTDLGYAVIEAPSGEKALELLNAGERVDLLVTDHLMPGMTGLDLIRMVREQRPSLPALVVSGYAESDGIDVDVPRLTKPFRKDELAASLLALST